MGHLTCRTSLVLVLGSLCLSTPAALAAEQTSKASGSSGKRVDQVVDDLAGPIVRATIDRARDSIIRQANLSVAEKKKTIAQIIDEALEQEFPEEKSQGLGKNYNETAKQDDVSMPGSVYHCNCVLTGSMSNKDSMLETLRERKKRPKRGAAPDAGYRQAEHDFVAAQCQAAESFELRRPR